MLKLKDLKTGLLNFWQDKKEPYKIPRGGIGKLCLGNSVEGRPIHYYRIGQGERKILFVSAMHGNETGTVKLAYRLLDHLRSHEYLHGKLTCFLVPCLNVDGFERAKGLRGYSGGRRGRLNAKKIDLNRNFPAPSFRSSSYVLPKSICENTLKYNREISPDGPEAENLNLSQGETAKKNFLYLKNCGEFGASEPEIKNLIDFVEKEKVSVIFSFHNIGPDVMGGKDELSKELVRIYAKETGYEILEDAEWRRTGQTGTMKDWCDERGISFVEIEGSTRYGSDWEVQKPALEAVLEYLAGKA